MRRVAGLSESAASSGRCISASMARIGSCSAATIDFALNRSLESRMHGHGHSMGKFARREMVLPLAGELYDQSETVTCRASTAS